MIGYIRTLAIAAVAAFGLSGAAAQAAVVNINDGDTINPINPGDNYLFEQVLTGTGGAGSFSFTFMADPADAPLPVLAATANLFSVTGATLAGAYLSWFDGTDTVTEMLGDITFGSTVLGVGGALSTLFTDPDALTQVLTLGWESRSGNIQVSVNVAAIPLPAGGLLLIGALGGLAVLRRRKAAA